MNKMVTIKGYQLVWFNEQVNVSIVCLRNIKTIYEVEYNSEKEDAFILKD